MALFYQRSTFCPLDNWTPLPENYSCGHLPSDLFLTLNSITNSDLNNLTLTPKPNPIYPLTLTLITPTLTLNPSYNVRA